MMFRGKPLLEMDGPPNAFAALVEEFAVRFDDIAPSEWRWPNFTPVEVACKVTGLVPLQVARFHSTMDALQRCRDQLQEPLFLLSMYRTPAHNRRVGGVINSQHLVGGAGDIVVSPHGLRRLDRIARLQGFTGIGRYPSRGFIHADTRPGRHATWGG